MVVEFIISIIFTMIIISPIGGSLGLIAYFMKGKSKPLSEENPVSIKKNR